MPFRNFKILKKNWLRNEREKCIILSRVLGASIEACL
jgi:hypothetical protein